MSGENGGKSNFFFRINRSLLVTYVTLSGSFTYPVPSRYCCLTGGSLTECPRERVIGYSAHVRFGSWSTFREVPDSKREGKGLSEEGWRECEPWQFENHCYHYRLWLVDEHGLDQTSKWGQLFHGSTLNREWLVTEESRHEVGLVVKKKDKEVRWFGQGVVPET